MALDIKRLSFFVNICEKRSLTAAARVSHVTQPVLSYHLAELEKSVGEPLLDRRANGVEPNEAGKVLLAHAREILAAVQAAELAMRERRNQPSGAVSVGLLASIAPVVGPALIRTCQTRYPDIALRIIEGTSLQLRAGIDDESFDLAVNLRERGDHTSQSLLVEDLYFVARRGFLDLRKEALPLSEALQHALLMPPKGHVVRSLLEDAAKSIGLPFRIQAEVEGLATLKMLVAQAVGPAILGFGAIKSEYEAGTFVAAKLMRPGIQREFILDVAGKRRHTKAVEKVRDILVREVQDLAP